MVNLMPKSLPIEIFDQTKELISNKNFTLTKFNQHFGSSNGQTRKPEFEQILQKSSLDLFNKAKAFSYNSLLSHSYKTRKLSLHERL